MLNQILFFRYGMTCMVETRGARKGGQGGALAPPWKLRCQESFMFKFAK